MAIARDREDRLCGYLICMSPSTAPEFALDDPLLGPWIAHARGDAQLGDAVLWHTSIDFTGDWRGRVQAGSVRGLLRDAAERAFGDNENEKLLRRVLLRGYIEPAASHEQAAIDLSLSRAAYFRRLRAAAERVAEYLASRP